MMYMEYIIVYTYIYSVRVCSCFVTICRFCLHLLLQYLFCFVAAVGSWLILTAFQWLFGFLALWRVYFVHATANCGTLSDLDMM